jgi:hypothetical protein
MQAKNFANIMRSIHIETPFLILNLYASVSLCFIKQHAPVAGCAHCHVFFINTEAQRHRAFAARENG